MNKTSLKLEIRQLVIASHRPARFAVCSLPDSEMLFGPDSFLECSLYIAEHSPGDLTPRMETAILAATDAPFRGSLTAAQKAVEDYRAAYPDFTKVLSEYLLPATGETLDALYEKHCADGKRRMHGETDERLRARMLKELTSPPLMYQHLQRYGTIENTIDWDCPDDKFGLPAGAHRLRAIRYEGKLHYVKMHNGVVTRVWIDGNLHYSASNT